MVEYTLQTPGGNRGGTFTAVLSRRTCATLPSFRFRGDPPATHLMRIKAPGRRATLALPYGPPRSVMTPPLIGPHFRVFKVRVNFQTFISHYDWFESRAQPATHTTPLLRGEHR